MANAPVPTAAEFRDSCTKPEAFASVDSSVIDIVLARKVDYLAAAFGDRATLPILEWDGSCVDAVFAFTARALMVFRGYKKSPEGDSEFVTLDVEAKKFRDGIKAKTEHPTFTDSTQGNRPDSPRINSERTSDAWTRRKRPCCP